ncbi:hypothetical protein E4634_21215 [Mangrovimicrobium sediminis]|uniref:Uncharacterized protein n=1 Tax=Mangrovimicrobium sediminis TaxID=2562682 RepID=A0A4Z0LSM2_9GAMM|nr:hypothetical protein [Haliea sp. SAOS-164]TGD70282.1 hypothetical protein E4634_21215 [Haliea sp. SAOS-164]
MLKFDLAKIADLFFASKKQKAENSSVYIRKVAEEAEELAKIWEEIVNSLLEGAEINREKLIALGAHKYIPKNGVRYTRLQAFYRNASTALAPNNATQWVDEIVYSIGSILVEREGANKNLFSTLENAESSFFFDKQNNIELLKDLSMSVVAMQKEASALYVLASQVEAQKI